MIGHRIKTNPTTGWRTHGGWTGQWFCWAIHLDCLFVKLKLWPWVRSANMGVTCRKDTVVIYLVGRRDGRSLAPTHDLSSGSPLLYLGSSSRTITPQPSARAPTVPSRSRAARRELWLVQLWSADPSFRSISSVVGGGTRLLTCPEEPSPGEFCRGEKVVITLSPTDSNPLGCKVGGRTVCPWSVRCPARVSTRPGVKPRELTCIFVSYAADVYVKMSGPATGWRNPVRQYSVPVAPTH